jgi:hypothetical protein
MYKAFISGSSQETHLSACFSLVDVLQMMTPVCRPDNGLQQAGQACAYLLLDKRTHPANPVLGTCLCHACMVIADLAVSKCAIRGAGCYLPA